MPPISSAAVALYMVKADGEEVLLQPANGIFNDRTPNLVTDTDLFNAAVVGVGSFGVITSIVMYARDQWWLKEERTLHDWENLKTELPDMIREVDFVEVLINAYSDDTCLPRSNKDALLIKRVPHPESSLNCTDPCRHVRNPLLFLASLFRTTVNSVVGCCSNSAWQYCTPALVCCQLCAQADRTYINPSHLVLTNPPSIELNMFSTEVRMFVCVCAGFINLLLPLLYCCFHHHHYY